MKSKKKKVLPLLEQVYIEKVASTGKCLARHGEMVVFVEGNAAPGDVVDLRVTQQKKKFWIAKPVAYHQYSEHRVAPVCQHFGVCGGCKWQHLSYAKQLEAKQQEVADQLTRIGKVALPLIAPIIPSASTYHYRNKLEFTFSNSRWLTKEEIESGISFEAKALGFHVPERFDKIVDIAECHLQAEPSHSIREAVKRYAIAQGLSFFDLRKQENLLRNLIIRTANTGEVMVLVIFAYEDSAAIEGLMAFLKENFPQISSLQYIVNTKRNDSYQDLPSVLYAGKPYITETMEDLQFRVGPRSFYQTNSAQAYQLYKIARTFAALTGQETVYDLYTGTGTIANFVAKSARKVVGVEYVEAAIEDARINAQINGIGNTSFFVGDMKDVFTADFIAAQGPPEVVITDPPRAGMHESVVQSLLQACPQRIVYVSCNPATQARDLALLNERYEVRAVQPVDMFPQTAHVENVAQLVLRSS